MCVLIFTDFVILLNNGNRCYINSVLQTLFMNINFRESILQVHKQDLTDYDKEKEHILLELKEIFVSLQVHMFDH